MQAKHSLETDSHRMIVSAAHWAKEQITLNLVKEATVLGVARYDKSLRIIRLKFCSLHYICKILCSRSWTLHDLKKYKCNFQNIREQNIIAHKHWNRCIFSEGRKVCIHKYDITRILLTRLWLFHVF